LPKMLLYSVFQTYFALLKVSYVFGLNNYISAGSFLS